MLYELTAIRPTTIGAARSHRCRPIGPLTSRAVAGVRTASAPVLIAEAPVPYGRAGPVTAGRTTAGNRAPAARAKSVVGAQLEDEAAAGRKRRVVIAPAPIAGPGHGLERRLPEHVVRDLEHDRPPNLAVSRDDETTDRPYFPGFPNLPARITGTRHDGGDEGLHQSACRRRLVARRVCRRRAPPSAAVAHAEPRPAEILADVLRDEKACVDGVGELDAFPRPFPGSAPWTEHAPFPLVRLDRTRDARAPIRRER